MATTSAAPARTSRYSLFPIQHHRLWDMYITAKAMFWTAEEVDMTQDVTDWHEKLTAPERAFVEHVLGFFANVDNVIIHNLAAHFISHADTYGLPPEATAFYSYQIFDEQTHAETYGLMIDAIVKDPERRHELFNSITSDPTIAEIKTWMDRWVMGEDLSIGRRLVGMACVEGIMFSAAFCSIFWLRKRGLMPGLCFANDLIARDEGLHMSFACELFRAMGCGATVSSRAIEEILRSAVDQHLDFVDKCLPVCLIGINSGQMKIYVQFVADRLALDLCGHRIYGVANPFPWMEQIGMEAKENFFERRVSTYQKCGVMAGGRDKIDAGAFAGEGDF